MMYYSKIVNSRVVKGARARVGREKKLGLVPQYSMSPPRQRQGQKQTNRQTKESGADGGDP